MADEMTRVLEAIDRGDLPTEAGPIAKFMLEEPLTVDCFGLAEELGLPADILEDQKRWREMLEMVQRVWKVMGRPDDPPPWASVPDYEKPSNRNVYWLLCYCIEDEGEED